MSSKQEKSHIKRKLSSTTEIKCQKKKKKKNSTIGGAISRSCYQTHHLESKESIEASLVMLPDSEDEAAPPFLSFVLAELSPTCDGFHADS